MIIVNLFSTQPDSGFREVGWVEGVQSLRRTLRGNKGIQVNDSRSLPVRCAFTEAAFTDRSKKWDVGVDFVFPVRRIEQGSVLVAQ